MYVYLSYYKKISQLYIKIFSLHKYKKIFCLLNIRMINLSFDERRLIAQNRNIRDYENKSKEDLIKGLSETKPETPKTETPKPKPRPKLEIKVNKRKLKNLENFLRN